ncbi:MAG: GNAT family N-acetyltransferase [Rhizobiaceae bacterium]
MSYHLKQVCDDEDWKHLHRIRREVLFTSKRHSTNYDENHADDRLSDNKPFLLIYDGEAIGVARLDQRGTIGIIRLVAIVLGKQRQGHGRKLGELLESEAQRAGIKILRVNAAEDATGFYISTSWHLADWDKSELAGIAQNAVQMEKRI